MTRTDLLQALSCPINWEAERVEVELAQWLNFLWFAWCWPNQSDREVTSLFSSEDWLVSPDRLELLDDQEIEAAIHNTARWRDNLATKYKRFVARLTQLSAATRDTYPKHYPPPGSTLAQVCSLSLQRSASVLRSEVSPELQVDLMWAALDDLVFRHMSDFNEVDADGDPTAAATHLTSLLGCDSLMLAVDLRRVFGASAGSITKFGVIDFDFSTPQFHMYPVSASEYHESEFKAYVQAWNYGLKH